MTNGSSATGAEADAIAAAVLTCPAVVALHGGPLSRLTTFLPGRRVEGVRIDDRVQVGVVATYGLPVGLVADRVRTTVVPLARGRQVDVHVADLLLPEEQPRALPAAGPPSVPDEPTPEQRRLRRALLRRHHPDLGGDPEQFGRVLQAFRSGNAEPLTHDLMDDEVRFVRRPRGLARIAAWCRTRRRRRHRPRRVV